MQSASHTILITMVGAIAAGVLLIAIARRLDVPSIVVLLAGGVALGPEGFGVVQPESLGAGLRVLVSLLVGIVLFEGGLTLDVDGYRQASKIIVRMLTVGVLTTWLGIALAVWWIGGLSLPLAVVSASLLIVTGPTVVGPLLKRIHITKKVHHVLHWEGVLIDPIGVFIAILALELFLLGKGTDAFVGLGLRVVSGLCLGLLGGVTLHQALKHRLLPLDMMGVGSLATAILLFGVSELIALEAGLLSVTVAGLYLGWRRPTGLPSVRHFKHEVTDLCIGMLFILLTARLDLGQFLDFGVAGCAIVATVMFVVRPVSVMLSTAGLDISLRERLLMSWIAPRGIVAATMASLLALELEQLGAPTPRFVETLTYAVIVGTIVIQGFSAGAVARRLGLVRVRPAGWLIVGANAFARGVARFFAEHDISPVLIVDTSRRLVRQATAEGLSAIVADARDTRVLRRRREIAEIGQLLAITPNEDLNAIVCRRWAPSLGAAHCHRWSRTPSGAGSVVWSSLPSPDAIAAEMNRGEARLLVGVDDTHRPHHRLLTISGGSAVLDPEASRAAPTGDGAKTLQLASRLDALGASLRDTLAFDLPASSRTHVVESALSRIGETFPHLPLATIRADIAEQESTLPASLGHGVAAPHALVDALEAPLCALVKLEAPVEWDAPDGQAVDIVLILLSPKGDPDAHLELLADLARKLALAELRDALRKQPVHEWAAVLRAGTAKKPAAPPFAA